MKKKGDVLKLGKLQTLLRKVFQYVSGIPHQVPFPYRLPWSPAGLPFVPPSSPETEVFWSVAAASILQQPGDFGECCALEPFRAEKGQGQWPTPWGSRSSSCSLQSLEGHTNPQTASFSHYCDRMPDSVLQEEEFPVKNLWLSTRECLSGRTQSLAVWPWSMTFSHLGELGHRNSPKDLCLSVKLCNPKQHRQWGIKCLVHGEPVANIPHLNHNNLSVVPRLVIPAWESLLQWHAPLRPGYWDSNTDWLMHWPSSGHDILMKLVILKVFSITLSTVRSHSLCCKP